MAVQLHVTVMEARGLPRTQVFGTQDPYCILTLGNRVERTEYHDNGGAEPFWNAPFVFPFRTASDTGMLDIDIRNANAAFLPDNSIGFAALRIDLREWQDRELRLEWLPVYRKQTKARDPKGAKPDGGEIKVRMEVLYDTTLARQPGVVVLTKQLKTTVISPPKSPTSQPPPSPSARPTTSTRPPPSTQATTSARPTTGARPTTPTSTPASPVGQHVHLDYHQHDSLRLYANFWIPSERYFIDKSHTARDLAVGHINKEPVLLQLPLSVVEVTAILKAYSTLPKGHQLLRLKGFSSYEHAWCIVYEHAVPLQHDLMGSWTRHTTQIAMDIASSMTQLHLAQHMHGGIRLAAVFKDDDGRHRLHGFGVHRASTADAIELPWAAPESLNDATLTRKCDVYAYGIFLAELALGDAAPFASHKKETRSTFLEAVHSGSYTLETELRDVVPAPILSVILKCTNPVVAKRPTSLAVVDLVRGAKDEMMTAPLPQAVQ
ncbi:hypothetical protein ACHHYP_10308 [Achlya hypogyna]|uniref:Protein kinase n=1 Tax=Achlya hypogyna TaxID=1202772 RepID=A0A1V9YLS0_ACHHY|nr:hypothetical protein ACHHYP_10308 [Achlya hypogyna]